VTELKIETFKCERCGELLSNSGPLCEACLDISKTAKAGNDDIWKLIHENVPDSTATENQLIRQASEFNGVMAERERCAKLVDHAMAILHKVRSGE
jgi:hypothetical protein